MVTGSGSKPEAALSLAIISAGWMRASIPKHKFAVDFSGKSGLLHVSEISHSRIDRVEDVFKQGDEVKVKLIGIDQKTGKVQFYRQSECFHRHVLPDTVLSHYGRFSQT